MTKRADYALLALSYLASSASDNPEKLVNTKEIAEQYEIPMELLAKILQILAKNGMVASHPGPSGGYRLLRDPNAISVAEVVYLIDGPVSLMHCSTGDENSCRQFNRCTIRDPLGAIEARVIDVLAKISIAEISALADAVPEPELNKVAERKFAAALPIV
jgi:Rrf2 family protein